MRMPVAGRRRVRAPRARSGNAAPRKRTAGIISAAAARAAGSCDRPGMERYVVILRYSRATWGIRYIEAQAPTEAAATTPDKRPNGLENRSPRAEHRNTPRASPNMKSAPVVVRAVRVRPTKND